MQTRVKGLLGKVMKLLKESTCCLVFFSNMAVKWDCFLKVKGLGVGLLRRTLDGFPPGAILSHPAAARSQGQLCTILEIQAEWGEAVAAGSGLAPPLLPYQEVSAAGAAHLSGDALWQSGPCDVLVPGAPVPTCQQVQLRASCRAARALWSSRSGWCPFHSLQEETQGWAFRTLII